MSTDRRDPEATPELQDEFWGEQAEWTPQRRPAAERQGVGASIGRWWSGLLGGDSRGERAHGIVGRASTSETEHRSKGSGEPIEGDIDALGDDWVLEREPRPGRTRGIDPLLSRFGGLAIIVTLAAPLVVGFASSGSASGNADSVLTTITSAPPVASTALSSAASDAPVTDPSASAGSQVGETAVEAIAPSVPEPATTAAVVTTPPCGSRYEIAAGDYWIRIADAAEVELAELLAVNDSTVDTVLVPGRSVCLPVGAATPSPPTTVATTSPATTPPTSTAVPSRSTPATVAPAPTTTVPARPAAVLASQAEAIIRDVWPDDLEGRALEIAWRESNFRSNVNNWCCYGLFQIHWDAHRSWLTTIGVTSAAQLYDPSVNASAAYMLYQRSGGFGPWGG